MDFFCVLTVDWNMLHISSFFVSLDSAVVNTLACHRCDPGLNPGVGMWQGSGCPSKVCGFPWVLRFPPPYMTTEC